MLGKGSAADKFVGMRQKKTTGGRRRGIRGVKMKTWPEDDDEDDELSFVFGDGREVHNKCAGSDINSTTYFETREFHGPRRLASI